MSDHDIRLILLGIGISIGSICVASLIATAIKWMVNVWSK